MMSQSENVLVVRLPFIPTAPANFDLQALEWIRTDQWKSSLPQLLRDHHHSSPNGFFAAGVKFERREVLQWLHEEFPHAHQIDHQMCFRQAVVKGDLQWIQWLHDHFRLDESLIEATQDFFTQAWFCVNMDRIPVSIFLRALQTKNRQLLRLVDVSKMKVSFARRFEEQRAFVETVMQTCDIDMISWLVPRYTSIPWGLSLWSAIECGRSLTFLSQFFSLISRHKLLFVHLDGHIDVACSRADAIDVLVWLITYVFVHKSPLDILESILSCAVQNKCSLQLLDYFWQKYAAVPKTDTDPNCARRAIGNAIAHGNRGLVYLEWFDTHGLMNPDNKCVVRVASENSGSIAPGLIDPMLYVYLKGLDIYEYCPGSYLGNLVYKLRNALKVDNRGGDFRQCMLIRPADNNSWDREWWEAYLQQTVKPIFPLLSVGDFSSPNVQEILTFL